MPFTMKVLSRSSNGPDKLMEIDIRLIDMINERLRITCTHEDGNTESAVCQLVNVQDEWRLRIDRERSDAMFVELIDELIIEEFGNENTDDIEAYVLSGPTTEEYKLVVSIPPVFVIGRGATLEVVESYTDPGDIMQVESITIN